eukprot:g9248.t1
MLLPLCAVLSLPLSAPVVAATLRCSRCRCYSALLHAAGPFRCLAVAAATLPCSLLLCAAITAAISATLLILSTVLSLLPLCATHVSIVNFQLVKNNQTLLPVKQGEVSLLALVHATLLAPSPSLLLMPLCAVLSLLPLSAPVVAATLRCSRCRCCPFPLPPLRYAAGPFCLLSLLLCLALCYPALLSLLHSPLFCALSCCRHLLPLSTVLLSPLWSLLPSPLPCFRHYSCNSFHFRSC